MYKILKVVSTWYISHQNYKMVWIEKKRTNLHKNISDNKNFNAQNTEIKMKHLCIGQSLNCSV